MTSPRRSGSACSHLESRARPATDHGLSAERTSSTTQASALIVQDARDDPPLHHHERGRRGKRFFPDGVRLDLDLVEERSFASGLIYAPAEPLGH